MIDNFLNDQQLFADPVQTAEFYTPLMVFYKMKSAKTEADFIDMYFRLIKTSIRPRGEFIRRALEYVREGKTAQDIEGGKPTEPEAGNPKVTDAPKSCEVKRRGKARHIRPSPASIRRD